MNESPKKTLSAREKITRLRAAFIEQLPGRISEIKRLFERLKVSVDDHEAAVELHRLLHGLKGTGRSFGFGELGAAAGQGEHVAAQLVDSPQTLDPDQWHLPMADYLSYLDMAATVACLPEAMANDEHMPPFTLRPEQAASTPHGQSSLLVYVCDDETLMLEQLASQLTCFGYEVVTFSDPQGLHDAVLAHRPKAVIMDINFPQNHANGTDALSVLRGEIGEPLPAIFLSARDDFSARLAAVQAGGEAYFHKPARTIELVAALDELINHQPHEAYRILIIDDEPEIAGYHAIILQEAGMATYQVSDPEKVLDALEEFRPDMVLMDMYMPNCHGRDLSKVIRQMPDYIGLPIVYLSSETDRQKQFSAMRVGAEGFLTKPVIPEDLVAAVAIRAERMRTLRSLMARDSLTGLFNHTTTTQLLENAIASAKRNQSKLMFAMIDIDHFKMVNDTHGHPVGDQVILALSRVLQQRLRNSDIVGRYGGEEFAVILQDVDLEQATYLLDALRTDFGHIVFHSPNGDFSCSFSAGIASFKNYRRLELLREAADKALYEAKRAGRNRVVTSQETP